MEYAPVSDYPEESIEFNYFNNNTIDTPNNLEPVCSRQTSYEESINIKELLLECLQGTEILPIDNKEYKNEEIDKIIETIESFQPKFCKLQDELDEIHKEYNSEKNNTRESILKIDSSIQFMKKLEDDYKIDDSVKDIVEKMNEYSKKLLENNKMKVSKEKYIEKRKELNSYLYFIQKLNKWNTSSICPICITSKIDSYCNPCGHTACKKCLERRPSNNSNNLNNSNKCPICREYIMEIRKLFFI